MRSPGRERSFEYEVTTMLCGYSARMPGTVMPS